MPHDPVAVPEHARDVCAHLDLVSPHGCAVEHRVETDDAVHVMLGDPEKTGHFDHPLPGDPPMLLLPHPERGQHHGLRAGIALLQLFDFLEAHL